MSKKIQKTLALIICMAMAFSAIACGVDKDAGVSADETKADRTKPTQTEADTDEDEDEEDDEDEAESVDGVETGENGLTYPDHVPTYDEIHPEHEPGELDGDEAIELLTEIESEVIVHNVSDYPSAAILFENPEDFGIELDDINWGGYSVETDEEAVALYQSWLDELLTIDYESLEGQDYLLWQKLVYDLEIELYGSRFTAFPYYESELNPLVGPQNDIMFLLHVIPFTTVEEAENYIELVRDTENYFSEICDFEEDRVEYGYINSDETYEAIAESFDALVEQEDDCFLYESFEDKLDNIEDLSDEDRERLVEEHEAAMHENFFPGFEECARRMRALEGNEGENLGASQYPGGDAYYAYTFMVNANSSMSVEEASETVDNALTNMMSSYIETMQDLSDTSWVNDYLTNTYSQGDTQENLTYLENAVGLDFPEVPEHSYTLLDVPEVFEDSFSPAAFLGYHLDTFDSNIIITNNSAVDDDFGITCAHEGYPGHLYQSLYTRSRAEHPYFYLSQPNGYVEGWGSYAEVWSYRYFHEECTANDLKSIETILNILVMARWDIGINYEGWTLEECADYYNDTVMQGLTEADPEDFADAYTLLASDYCYAVKYGMGFLNTNTILLSLSSSFPDANAYDIHEAYLNAMPVVFELAYETAYYALDENF